jgi:hypothetical protein
MQDLGCDVEITATAVSLRLWVIAVLSVFGWVLERERMNE